MKIERRALLKLVLDLDGSLNKKLQNLSINDSIATDGIQRISPIRTGSKSILNVRGINDAISVFRVFYNC